MLLGVREITKICYEQNRSYLKNVALLYPGKGRLDLPPFEEIDEKTVRDLEENTRLVLEGKAMQAPERNTNQDKMMYGMCTDMINVLKEID